MLDAVSGPNIDINRSMRLAYAEDNRHCLESVCGLTSYNGRAVSRFMGALIAACRGPRL
jgi:hypothetical protein